MMAPRILRGWRGAHHEDKGRPRNGPGRLASVLFLAAGLLAPTVGCGDPAVPPPPGAGLPAEEEEAPPPTCSGSWVTVCRTQACEVVCLPRLTPERVEACEDECRAEGLELVEEVRLCVWACVERRNQEEAG